MKLRTLVAATTVGAILYGCSTQKNIENGRREVDQTTLQGLCDIRQQRIENLEEENARYKEIVDQKRVYIGELRQSSEYIDRITELEKSLAESEMKGKHYEEAYIRLLNECNEKYNRLFQLYSNLIKEQKDVKE